MKKQQDIRAKKVTVIVNTENADYTIPVLERLDFVVPYENDDHKLLRFLCDTLRRNKIIFDDIKIGKAIWARDVQLWTRKRIEGCIRSQNRVADMLEEIYCEPILN